MTSSGPTVTGPCPSCVEVFMSWCPGCDLCHAAGIREEICIYEFSHFVRARHVATRVLQRCAQRVFLEEVRVWVFPGKSHCCDKLDISWCSFFVLSCHGDLIFPNTIPSVSLLGLPMKFMVLLIQPQTLAMPPKWCFFNKIPMHSSACWHIKARLQINSLHPALRPWVPFFSH